MLMLSKIKRLEDWMLVHAAGKPSPPAVQTRSKESVHWSLGTNNVVGISMRMVVKFKMAMELVTAIHV